MSAKSFWLMLLISRIFFKLSYHQTNFLIYPNDSFNGISPYMYHVGSGGYIDYMYVWVTSDMCYIKLVINLKGNISLTGTGTISNPYQVEET